MGSRVSSATTFEVGGIRAALCVAPRRANRGPGPEASRRVTSPGQERPHDARTPRRIAAASSSLHTTFLICLRLEADGRNCANKRACSNNKSVPCIAPGGVSGLHGRMLMRDDRQTHCSIHTHSLPRHQTYLRNRQKRRCEWKQGSMRFSNRYFHMLKLLDAVADMVTRGRVLLVNLHAFWTPMRTHPPP